MKRGDFVFVDFPFTDLSGKKKRPALVLTFDAVDATLAFITTKLFQAQPADVLLISDVLNGLKMPSVIRTSKLATLKLTLIQGRLGELTAAEIAAVGVGLVQSLSIKLPL